MKQLDVCDLISRDHDELDRALAVLANPSTSSRRLAEQLDIVQLTLAVHAATEVKTLDSLRARVSDPCLLALISRDISCEHKAHQRAANALMRRRPGSVAWYDAALELRAAMLVHISRAQQMCSTIREYTPRSLREQLAIQYATDRMLVVTSASPHRIAARRTSLQRA